MEAVHERVRRLRERSGLSQRDAERESGLSQSTWSRIESGARQPSAIEIVAIADAIGATVGEVTGTSHVRTEAVSAARAEGEAVEAMLEELTSYLELSDHLDRQGFGSAA